MLRLSYPDPAWGASVQTAIAGRAVPVATDVRITIDYWGRRLVLEFPGASGVPGSPGSQQLVFDEVAEIVAWRESTLAWGELFSVSQEPATEMFDALPSGNLRRKEGPFQGMLCSRTGEPRKVRLDGQGFSVDFLYCGSATWHDNTDRVW